MEGRSAVGAGHLQKQSAGSVLLMGMEEAHGWGGAAKSIAGRRDIICGGLNTREQMIPWKN